MVADFMRDHVGLGEIAGRAEPARQLVEEGGVEVELAVGGAVERPGRRRGATAGGLRRPPKQHEPRRFVARAHRLEHGLPDVFGVAEDGGDEVLRRILRCVGRTRRAARRALRTVTGRGCGAALPAAGPGAPLSSAPIISSGFTPKMRLAITMTTSAPPPSRMPPPPRRSAAGVAGRAVVDVVAPAKIAPAHVAPPIDAGATASAPGRETAG